MGSTQHKMDFTSLSQEEVLGLARQTPEYTKARTQFDFSRDFDWSDDATAISTLRQLGELQEQTDTKHEDVEEEIFTVATTDDAQLPLKVFRPAASNADGGLIVLYYGGGFVVGSPITMAPLARCLAKRFDAVVVTPKYRLAPEHPFPTSVNDGWDVFKWIADHSITTLRAKPFNGFIVGGISAGANQSNIITHLARDRGLQPPITGNWLSVPVVNLAPKDEHKLPQKYRERNLSRSLESEINSATLPPAMVRLIERSLKRDANSELGSPLIWPGEGEFGHKGMPRTYCQVCGADAGRDELLIYEDMLKAEGVETRVDMYPGLPHVFWSMYKELVESKQWEQTTMRGFEWLLRKPSA